MLNCVYSFAIWLLITVVTEGVGGCSMDRIDKAAIVGDDISVRCNAGDGLKVYEWRFEGDVEFVIFKTAYYDPSTGAFVAAYVKDGYFMDNTSNPILKESTLTIKNVNHSNAGGYSCQCAVTNTLSPSASAISNIVIVSTPKFSTTTDLRDGEPISFICNVSFSGIANSSIAIEDSMGTDFTTGNYTANSRGLHNFTLTYDVTADSSIDQIYWCNFTLTNDSSNTQIYSTKLEASVQWTPVQNVEIIPEKTANCMNGGQCALNEVVICSAGGNPTPVTFNWTISINGSVPIEANIHGDRISMNNTGQHTIQCTAFNFIKGVSYQNISDTFTTQVTVDGPQTESSQQAAKQQQITLIIGLVVGLVGGFILVALIIVLFILWKRKKSRTGCCNVEERKEEERTPTIEAMELSKSNKNNSSVNGNGLKSNVHTTPGVQNKSFEKNLSDDVLLVENELYSGKSANKQIDPSDGGYASLNEVGPQGK